MAITERAKGLEYGETTVKKDEQKRKGVISLGLQQIIAKNQNAIVQKFQSLLTNYSNNVTNFYNEVSKRYEGRAFDFNDNYVADAGAWNESTKQKVDSLKAEKAELENYINSYGSLFDEQWVSQITSSINSNSKYLDNILKNAQTDADYWGSFENENQYNEWAKKEKDYYDNWGKYSKEKDFKYFSELGNNIENPTHAEAIGWMHVHGLFTGNDYYFGGEKVNNKVTFVKDNYGTLALGNDSNETLGYLKYSQMTDEEVGVYNYLLAKYGEAKAEELLDYLDNENLVNASLTQREAGSVAQAIQNMAPGFAKTLVYAGNSLASGISQNIQNFVQFFQEDVRPTTQIEYQNQYLQQDLTGAAKYLYQAGNTIGNMLPSIAISIATGGAGAALGSLQMGASAAGGAYAQAIKEGYSVGQARLYSTLVGAAEGGLQYALGGISKLGGKALSSVATKAAQIENVFLRVAAKTGLSLGGEILEEELQNFIEPLLKTIIMGEEYDAPTWSELLETAIVTAISTGVLEGASIAGYEVSAAENKKLYAGQEQQIVDRLLEIDADNVYAQRIKENLDKGKTLSGNQITQIIQQTFDREVELKKQAVKYNRQIAKAEKQGLYPTLENFEVKDAERTTPTQDQETGYKLLEKPSSNKMGATTQNALKTDDYEGTELLDIEQPKAEQPKAEQQKNNVQAKSKVKAEDQPKTEAKTATTIEEVSKKYGKHATAMAKAYLPNQDVNEYAKAFDKVYKYAKSGASLSSIWKLLDIGVLTDTQVEIAYEMGDYASKEAAKEQDAKNKKLGDNKTRKKGVVAGEGVSIDELSKSFNDTQRKAYKTMQYIAEATGVNIVFFKSEIKDGKFVGEQGRYERAKKGTIFIDINAGLNNEMDVQDLSNYTMLRTFTHEFTHFIEDLNPQQYNELRKAVFERLEQQGVDVEALIEAQQSYGLSVEQASREVVAEAMADILPDSTFIETLANKHKNIFEKLLAKLKEFLANIKAYFESINKNISAEARAMKESVGESVRYVENIVKLFDKAAIGAVENLQKVEQQQAENKVIEDLNSKGIAIDEETDTAVMLSARHAPKTEEEIEATAQNIQKALGVTIQEARQWVRDEVSIANLILNDKYAEYLDYDFDGRRAAIQKNSDFPQGTVDFSNLCPKRIDYTNTMNKVLKNFPNRIITAAELAQIRQIMVEEGIEVACGVCFVEDRRQNDTKVADSFINDLARYRQGETTHEDGKPFNAKQLKAFALMGEESYTPNLYELATREGLNKLSREHKSVAEAWNIYNNARGMQAVRLIQNESEYKREILKYSKDKVRRINNAGGLRIFSFSDFTEYHLIDIIQIIQDCAVMGIKIQGYTKVPAFAKLVEKTGVKLNRSLIPKGALGYHLENGKVVLDYDRTEGIDIEDENFVDTTDNPDVGNIVIGINDEQISAAMLDDFIDYIIPFHTGQSKEVLRIKKLATWNNYKDFQTDKDIETGTTAKKQVNIYTDVLNAAEKEGKPITNKVEFVNKYLQVCKEKGLKPRFWQFLNKDANGDYSYREGYHKLLLDFKMFDKNGNILPQKPVTPNFDAPFMMDLLKEYAETKAEKSKTLAPKLEKVYERITKEILTDDVVQRQNREYDTNGNKLTQKQSEYFADSLITDNNGNLKTVYHGSSKIFTKFDHSFIGEHGSMEGQGFYFTDKKEVAEGYQRKGGQLLEGYLNITKPLSDSEVTLQKAEVRKLLKEIDPTGDDIVINYDSLGGLGYPSKTWYERALNDTVNSLFKYSETDSEILADISNSGGQRDVILKVRDILGYDGYIVKNKYDGADVYVAFDSNQFKLASNKNPTADEDIQLQRRENLTNREILELMTVSFNAEEMSQLTDAELDALEIFKKQTTEIYELQEMRLQEGAVFVENQFKKDGDRKLAQEAKNRVAIIDEKIKNATDRLMQIQEAEVIKKILPKARKIVGRYERIQTKQLASQYRKETREKINEVKEKAKAEKFDALARYRERMQNAATIKKYKERIEADVKELTKWIVSPDNKNYLKHVPDVLKDAVVPFLESIDFTSKRQLRGGEETIADKKFVKQLNALMKAFKGTTDVEKMYSGYYDLPADFIENLQYFIDATQDLVGSVGGEYIINKMTAEELASLSKVVRALKHFIPQVNKFHNNAMYQHVYEAGDESISTLKKIKTSTAGELDNFLFWKNTRPIYGFERMGKGAMSIFWGLEKGQEQKAKNDKEIIDFAKNAYTREEVKKWEQELHTIEIEENGEKVTFQMTTSQIMGFYCLAKQQDSLQHMDNGGIRIPTMKIKGKKYANEEHKVSRTDIKNIISKLTDRQKAVADKLQKYMATKGAEWGNYVSVARFGEKLFTNPDYYPINSDGRHLESMADKELSAASLYALLNMSFTKSRNQLANNTILVYSIFDVFANHMASMSRYNAMALPVLDAIKWLNYEQKDITAEGKRIVKGSVKGEMDRAFGVPEETKSSGKMGYAQSFVSNIIKSFNGTESSSSANDSLGIKALHIYNRAQIAFNLRVVIQQPLSIVRAGQIISYKSILKGLKASPKQAKANVEEMLNHSGIALWKSLGFYDINVSRGLTSLIKHDETFIDKVTEAGMFLAEKADERTWAAMWSACKEEVIAKGTAPTDAKFFDKVNELFAEVIHKTQVVDSTLTKTEYMRDKGFFPRAMSSFMSEPITSASMVFNAFFNYRTDLQRGVSPKQAWENNKNNIARTVVVYGLSQTLLAVVQSFQDAARDDDDYETYLQKFGEALKSNLVDEASLLGKIPVVKNFLEFAKEMLATWFPNLGIYGNEPPTVFAQWGDAIIKGSKILHDRITGKDTNYTTYSWVFKLLQGVSGITGLPIANITREIITLWNNTVGRFAPSLKVKSYDPGEKNSIKYAYRDGYLSEEEAVDLLVKQGMDKDDAYFFIQKEGKYDALYESILSGEGYAEAVEHLTEHGVTMDNITSTARSQIHKWLNEATITKDKAIELLVTYGELKKDVAQSRVEFWVVKHENNLEGFTEAAYNKYLKECAKSGMDVKVFYNAWQYKNEVDDKRKTLDYIYTLDIPQNQKRALIMCFY